MADRILHNEPELLARIAQGDEAAFAILFDHYTSLLHLHIRHIVKMPIAVEEIIQETFIQVWIHRDQLPGIQHPRSWISAIASNLCFNWLRARFREDARDRQAALALGEEEEPLKAMEHKEIRQIIREAVTLLPAQRKLIWQLHREHGLKQAEIADQLNISVSTVKNTLAQSLESIRGHLREKGYWIPLVLVRVIIETFFTSR